MCAIYHLKLSKHCSYTFAAFIGIIYAGLNNTVSCQMSGMHEHWLMETYLHSIWKRILEHMFHWLWHESALQFMFNCLLHTHIQENIFSKQHRLENMCVCNVGKPPRYFDLCRLHLPWAIPDHSVCRLMWRLWVLNAANLHTLNKIVWKQGKALTFQIIALSYVVLRELHWFYHSYQDSW